MWTEHAACTNSDSDLFFDPTREYEAIAVCRTCNVRAECLDYAISHRIEFGIWGGTTSSRRKKHHRRFTVERV